MAMFTFEGQPGLRLLTNEQIEEMHEKALQILETTGVFFDSEDALQILKDHGAKVNFEQKIAKLPPKMVLDALKQVPGSIQLYDTDGQPAALLGGNNVHFDPGSAALNFLASDGLTVHPSRAEDLQNVARVTAVLDNLALQSTALTLSDVPKLIGDSYRVYLLLKNCRKPIITGAFSIHGITHMHELLAAVAGGYDELREKPRAVFDVCSSPALKWTEISCRNIIDCARYGLPIETISVPMLGAASPATLAGSILLHTAETLSGITLAQCVSPGTPMVYGGAPMYFDMRYSTTSLNAMEATMISAAYAQLGKYYGLPTHTYACLSDSKLVDSQAGLESSASGIVALLAGINVISGPGMLDFCNTFSLEKLVIDNEICGMALRLAKGIDCSEEALAMELICRLGPGGDYLSTEHTFNWFKREPYMPSTVIDRKSRTNWEGQGAEDAFVRAQKLVKDILEKRDGQPLAADKGELLDQRLVKIMQELNVTSLPIGPKL